MIHPTHNPIRFKSTAMAEEAQICMRCASVVPEVLAKPCARFAEDQAVEMAAEDIRQALETAEKVRRFEELAGRLPVDVNGPVISLWRLPDGSFAGMAGSFAGMAGIAAESALEALISQLASAEAASDGIGDK